MIREFKHYKVNGFSITEAKRRLAEFENFYKNKYEKEIIIFSFCIGV